jgi:heme/copper-type cytochrome/quinol oxidase subunit 2
VPTGQEVVLLVSADVADEVHLHGYDLKVRVVPGKTARLAFRARLPGRFEVELEEQKLLIAQLEVRP